MNLLLFMQYIHTTLQKPSPFVKFFNILFSFAFFFHRTKGSISNKTGLPDQFYSLHYSTPPSHSYAISRELYKAPHTFNGA